MSDALVTEDWAENTLSRVCTSTSLRGLCNELGKALQIRIEREGESRETEATATDLLYKPHIFFTAPRYAKKFSKAMFPRSKYDTSCWNCAKRSHFHAKCLHHINFKVFAARKASIPENEQKKERY